MNTREAEAKADRIVMAQTIRAKRAAFASEHGPFVTAMRAAMVQYHQMRDEGVSQEDAVRGLELVLRESWPHRPSKFPPKCDICDGVGWESLTCRIYARCERPRCNEKGDDWTHAYVVPCSCDKGDRFRRPASLPPREETGLAAVGRRKKRPTRGFMKAV